MDVIEKLSAVQEGKDCLVLRTGKPSVMKSILFTVLVFFFCLSASFAQQKVDKYCKVSIGRSGWSSKITTIEFSGGNIDSLFSFKDSTVINNLLKVRTMRSDTDVLNYMSSLGWTPLNLNTIPSGFVVIWFRRAFDISELAGQ
jgi:hypothetical protein